MLNPYELHEVTVGMGDDDPEPRDWMDEPDFMEEYDDDDANDDKWKSRVEMWRTRHQSATDALLGCSILAVTGWALAILAFAAYMGVR